MLMLPPSKSSAPVNERKPWEETALMKKMLSLLKEEGYNRVSLSCQKANYAANWYMKLGFRVLFDKDDEYIMVYDL